MVEFDFTSVVFERKREGVLKASGEFFDVGLKAGKEPTERDHGERSNALREMFVKFAQVLDDLFAFGVEGMERGGVGVWGGGAV